MATEAEPGAALRRRDNGIWSDSAGRFDLWESEHEPGVWVAIDWDSGKRRRGAKAECVAWCRARSRAAEREAGK